MWRTDSLEKIFILGKIKSGKRRGWQQWDSWMASPTQWTWVWVNFGSWWWTGRRVMLQYMGPRRVGHNWATELKWTKLSLFGGGSLLCKWAPTLWLESGVRQPTLLHLWSLWARILLPSLLYMSISRLLSGQSLSKINSMLYPCVIFSC